MNKPQDPLHPWYVRAISLERRMANLFRLVNAIMRAERRGK